MSPSITTPGQQAKEGGLGMSSFVGPSWGKYMVLREGCDRSGQNQEGSREQRCQMLHKYVSWGMGVGTPGVLRGSLPLTPSPDCADHQCSLTPYSTYLCLWGTGFRLGYKGVNALTPSLLLHLTVEIRRRVRTMRLMTAAITETVCVGHALF